MHAFFKNNYFKRFVKIIQINSCTKTSFKTAWINCFVYNYDARLKQGFILKPLSTELTFYFQRKW